MSRIHRVVFPVFISLCLSQAAFADAVSVPSAGVENVSVPSAAKVQSPQYTLGAGDLLSLHVQDLDDVSNKPVRIDPSGNLDLPLIGRIPVAGLTVEQFRQELSEKLVKYIESPQIAISVLEYHSQPVSILGSVNSPGVQQLQGPKRLLDLISSAGGLKPEAGSKITITRQVKWGAIPVAGSHTDSSGQFFIAEVPTDELTVSQNPSLNIDMRPNDTVTVPKADIVYVMGQVKRAGGFPITSNQSMSLLKAVALAEGLDRDAAPNKARIMRASHTGSDPVPGTPVDLKMILAGKAPDVQLHADDVLFIPDSATRSGTRRFAEAAIQVATGVAIYRR